jgi:chloramphenicol-sensitive protein RarD
MNRTLPTGAWYALGAYAFWGLLPIYFKALQQVAPLQIVAHRVIWSWVLLLGWLLLSAQWRAFRRRALDPLVLRTYVVAGLLIAVNWLVYVWAVNNGFLVETSLGYFINPLVSVVLGVLVLGERLRPWQWAAVALAAAGVLYLSWSYGALPWIALTLALSFGLYGLVKKRGTLGAVHGLTLETAVLLPPAGAYLGYLHVAGEAAFLHLGPGTDLLLIAAGLITITPLLLFAAAARRIPLWLVGMLQYIAPTLQLALGVLIYGEPFTAVQLTGFGLVWAALALFSIDGLRARRAPPVAVPE